MDFAGLCAWTHQAHTLACSGQIATCYLPNFANASFASSLPCAAALRHHFTAFSSLDKSNIPDILAKL